MTATSLPALDGLATLCLALALFAGAGALARITPRALPTGPRGKARQRARDAGLALIDLPLRCAAVHLARLPLARVRAWLEQRLVRGGDFLGLDPDELLALCVLSGALGACAGVALASVTSLSAAPMLGGVLGALAPAYRLRREIRARAIAILRSLPPAIDLLALCMGAGLDFRGALAIVARELGPTDRALAGELERVEQELALGRTRRDALRALALRAPSPAMHELVAAVIQAEQKGNPLAQALEVQAQLMRMRRSVAAEEAAVRAALLLMLPMMLLMGAILTVLFTPFVIGGLGM